MVHRPFTESAKRQVREEVDVDDEEEEVEDVARDRFKHFCDCSIDRCIQSIVIRLF